MKISVAMTTYNGEKYIVEQLDSLRKQTRPIDEMFISDDGSTDHTIEIVKNYIDTWKLDNWHFYINKVHKGWIYNFHQCIEKTSGDILFFCDQDDLWNVHKIEVMSNYFKKNKDIDVLSCGASLIDNDNNFIKKFKLPFVSKESGRLKKSSINNKFVYNIRPGCCMAVRGDYVKKLKDCSTKFEIPHDAYYWKTATFFGRAYFLDYALISYRIHSENASNPAASDVHYVKTVDKRCKEVQSVIDLINSLKAVFYYIGIKNQNDKRMKLLNKIVCFEIERKKFLKKEIQVIPFFLKNIRYYRSQKMFLGDFLCRIKG